MRYCIAFLGLIYFLEARLIPMPFYESIQRIGRDTTLKYCEKAIFSEVYGVAMVEPKGTNATLLVTSDPDWCRLIYTAFEEGSKAIKYLRKFGGFGSASGKYFAPKGLCIDTTVYNSITNEYSIYVADTRNNRVTKETYKINEDTIIANGNLVSGLNEPTDVACVSISGGGAYIVIVEKSEHKISLYKRKSNGADSLVQVYGTRGPGEGEFFEPQGVAVCVATDANGGYFIYVTDTGNRRVVCLRYKSSTGITWKSEYHPYGNARLLSVAASQYYCVYVTDFTQNKIWVFTPGIDELLYTYGNADTLNGPIDICIDWDRIGLTEKWTATTGIQHFEIVPEIREFYPEPGVFDATEDTVKINFRVDETGNWLTMTVGDKVLIDSVFYQPGFQSVYWNGRDSSGNVALPDTYEIIMRCGVNYLDTADVIVKGTQVSGTISVSDWTETGEPYAVTDNVTINQDLTIHPGVKVMPVGNYKITINHGRLIAEGTTNNDILFTPYRKILPQPDPVSKGFWKYISCAGSLLNDTLRFKNCTIEAAGSENGSLYVPNDSGVVIIDSCSIIDGRKYGILLGDKRTCNLLVTNSIFEDDSVPARCLFTGVFGFGAGNEYSNNAIEKIEVFPCSLRHDMTIKKQDVPFWFRKSSARKIYEVYGDTNSVTTLTIDPGTMIEFDDSTSLEIGRDYQYGYIWYNQRGKLICEGTVTDTIKLAIGTVGFKKLNESKSREKKEIHNAQKNRRESSSFWRGLRFDKRNSPCDTSKVKYASIEYAGLDTAAIVFGDSTSISIESTKVFKSKNYGMWLTGARPYDNFLVAGCLFQEDSIPIISLFDNLNGLLTCSFLNNNLDVIEILAKNPIHNDLYISSQPIPYYFLNRIPNYSPTYQITGTQSLAILTIEPGTQIKCDENVRFLIGSVGQENRGKIIAQGTDSHSIIFSAIDTVKPWLGIHLYSNHPVDTSIFDYCELSYGWKPNSYSIYGKAMIACYNLHTPFTLSNSIISHSQGCGYSYNASSGDLSVIPEIKNNQFISNDSFPLIIHVNYIRNMEGNTFTDNRYNEICVNPYTGAERVNKSFLWRNQGVPYLIAYSFNIEGHGDTVVTVEIESGNTLRFPASGKIDIMAGDRLIAHNTIFTRIDSVSSQGVLFFDDADTSIIDSCVIENVWGPNQNLACAIGLDRASKVKITNSVISNNRSGVVVPYYNSGSAYLYLAGNQIALNETGVWQKGQDPLVVAKYNEFMGNKCACMSYSSSGIIQADSNWWGDATGPWDPVAGDPLYNPTGRGDSVGAWVNYDSWLTSPVQTPVVMLIEPNGGDSLYCEGNYEIKWSRTTAPLEQELFYTLDFPQGSLLEAAFWQFIDTVTASESSYVWSVPNTPSSRFRVAVKSFYDGGKSSYDKRNHQAKLTKSEESSRSGLVDELLSTTLVAIDISDSNSYVVDTISPEITLFEPNGGEYFIPSVEDTVKWQASDNHKLGYFDIYVSTDNGENYDLIEEYVDPSCSTYSLTPWEANSYKCKAKVVAHDSSDNCKDDVSDSMFAIPIKSKINEMTAYNNAYRLRRASGASLHLVYSHKTGTEGSVEKSKTETNDNNSDLLNGRLAKKNEIDGGGGPPPAVEKVYYIKSTNNGGNWSGRTLMGEGIYPAMAMNSDASKIGVSWTNLTQTKVLYDYYSSSTWSGVQTLLDEVTDVTYAPVAVQYASDSIHLVTLRNTIVDEDELVQDVLYLKFPYDDPYSVFMDTVDHWRICGEDDSMPRFASLAVDNNRVPYAVWERPPGDTMFNAPLPAFDVFYARCLKAAWSKENISSTDDNSINPSIEYYGGHVYVVWQEKIDGYCIFLMKRNYTQYPPVTETDTISQTSGNAMYPVTKKGGIILWSAGDTSEIYGRIWNSQEEEWLDIGNWSNTGKSSRYPVVDAWQNEGGTDIMAGWTEDSNICGYGQKYVSIFPSKGNDYVAFPSYCLKLGDSMSTPFTRYREGTAVYGNRKYDIGADSLVYHLPHIDKQAICKVYLELYRPNPKDQPADSNKWKIRLEIDGIMSHNLHLSPGEFKTVELTVPAAVNSDGEATINFRKIDGECILVRRILFYEFERNEEFAMTQYADGCQGGEAQFTAPVLLTTLYPNPVKGNLIMRVQLPIEQQMKIVLYDITGRIVTEIFNDKVAQGVNQIQFLTDKLAAGVYFISIETEKMKEIEKVIILK